MARPLGENQWYVLKSLAENGPYPGGWMWTNHSTTIRLLDSLVRRGLATRTEKTRTIGSGPRAPQEPYGYYEISQAGREELSKGPLALRSLLRF